jgi:hypothetical protein
MGQVKTGVGLKRGDAECEGACAIGAAAPATAVRSAYAIRSIAPSSVASFSLATSAS